MSFIPASIRRYIVAFVVFFGIILANSIYENIRDANAMLDEPLVERHGTFVMQQFDTFGRSEVLTPYGVTKKLWLDPALPMAPQVKRSLGIRDFDITQTATLPVLESLGHVRRTTQRELDAWIARKKQKEAFDAGPHEMEVSPRRRYYTLIKPTGTGMFLTDRKGRMLIPERFGLDDAPQGAESYYRMREGDCWGSGYLCRQRMSTGNASCFERLPREFDLHMLGVMQGARDSGIRVDNVLTSQIDVYVGSTARPVVLALGAMEATTWAFHLEPGANIAAVLVSGHKSQAIGGLPASVPSRFTHDRMTPNECGNGYGSHMSGDLEGLSLDLRDIFGRDVAEYQEKQITHYFEVGADFNLPEARSHALFGDYGNTTKIPQIEIDRASLRYGVAPPESGAVGALIPGGTGGWYAAIFDPTTLPFVISLILLVRPLINVFRRYFGQSTFGPPAPVRSITRSYFQGISVTAAGFTAGIIAVDRHPILQEMSLPLIVVALLAVVASPVVRMIHTALRGAGFDIGFSCIAAGAATACGVAWIMVAMQGWDPSLLLAPVYGGLGGLEFWRARRFPGATAKGAGFATVLSLFGGEAAGDTLDTSQAAGGVKKRRSRAAADDEPPPPPRVRRKAPPSNGSGGFGKRSHRPAR